MYGWMTMCTHTHTLHICKYQTTMGPPRENREFWVARKVLWSTNCGCQNSHLPIRTLEYSLLAPLAGKFEQNRSLPRNSRRFSAKNPSPRHGSYLYTMGGQPAALQELSFLKIFIEIIIFLFVDLLELRVYIRVIRFTQC